MEQIQLTYNLSKEIVTKIMMLYKTLKAMVRSAHEDTDFFDIVAGALQEDIEAQYLFILCLD